MNATNQMDRASLVEGLGETMQELRKEVNRLATDDISSVVQNIGKFVEKEMSENPYRTIAAAVSIGFGLGSLNASHAKNAAIHVSKLVAMRALSKLEVQQPGANDVKH